MWLEIELDASGDVIRVAGRGSRGERPPPRTLTQGLDALQAFAARVGRAVRGGKPLDPAAVADAQALHDALFSGELRDVLARLGEASKDRILVRLFARDPALQAVPWEALCKPGASEGFLGTDPRALFARGVMSPDPFVPRAVTGAVRVLGVAPGSDRRVLDTLRAALGPSIDAGEIEWLDPIAGPDIGARALFDQLRRAKRPHVLHYVGHGGVDPSGKPVLRLGDDEDGEEVWMSAAALARELSASFSEDLRLVVLEACDGAKAGALGSAADIIAGAGADAVVAHLWPVKTDTARVCSEEIYRALAGADRGQGDIGAAVAAARRTLLADSAEAFSPILYLRGPGSVLFDFAARRVARPGAKPPAKPLAPAAPPPRVFISCRGDVAVDVEVALSFYEALAAAGAAPFLAPKSVAPSDNWVRAVSQALRTADAFLLVLSEQATVSEMVAAELDLARELRERQAGKPLVFPVRVGFMPDDLPGHPLQERLQGLEDIGWGSAEDTPDVVRALLEALGRRDLVPARPVEEKSSSTSPLRSVAPPTAGGVALELPGGVVKASSPFYVVRTSIEEACLREVSKPGALIRIKGPKQTGKTSLMARLLDHAARAGARTVRVDLQMADGAIVGDLNRLLRWLCAVASRQLEVPPGRIDDAWDAIFGAKDNCTAYFEEHLLPRGDALVLALDNVERAFEAPVTAEELLALLRAWHEMGKSLEGWRKVRLLLVHATEIYLPMNINRSPFNVGLPAALSEWDAGMVHALARRHGLAWTEAEVDALMSLLGGHPHLIRIALYHLAQGMSLDEVVSRAGTDQGLFADHLKHLLWHVQSRPDLHEAARRVMAATEPVRLSAELTFKLASLGLVHLSGNDVRPARELYRRYLNERLPVRG